MDSSDSIRGPDAYAKRVHYIDVFGPDLKADLQWLAGFEPETFTRLVKALAEGNGAIENTILRRWRVR